ncbi:MAG: hypothetical protein PUG48_02170, partial [Clostridia bacterium]|nr:hypothetical protein [Clostridia bacterium]
MDSLEFNTVKGKILKTVVACLSAAFVFQAMPFVANAVSTDSVNAENSQSVSLYENEETEKTYPEITGFENTDNGVTITWSEYTGAAKYRLFVLNNSLWEYLCDTESLSYTHNSLINKTTYTYTVQALDNNNEFIGGYCQEGYSNTFYAPPAISSLSNINGGVEIKWNKNDALYGCQVYRKTADSEWQSVGVSDTDNYVDKDVSSGVEYFYTISCLDENGKEVSTHNSIKKITYIQAPEITSIKNTSTGSQINWSKCDGAEKYRVLYKDKNGNWKTVGTTTSTSFTHDKLSNGLKYTYTVRCLDKDG